MAQLKNPQGQIPGGYRFHVAATNWDPQPFSSLDAITQQLIAHRQGRPDLVAKYGWSLDPAVVRQEVEHYNIQLCLQNGWNDFLVGGGEGNAPFPPAIRPPLLQRAKNVVGGGEILVDWIQEGQPVVQQETANRRAEICAACPKNGKGGLEAYFTVPVSNAIRHELERKLTMRLQTPYDEAINVCEACSCPLKLKVWMPLESILPKISPEQKAALDPICWITK